MKQTRRIAVVTDSTAYLPPQLVADYDIHVVPLVLIMGDKSWRDNVDIDPQSFYELLRTSPDFPGTSQPSVAAFQELFSHLSKTHTGIAAVLVSEKLSGTLDSARAAAANLSGVPIELVDSQGVSMMLGFPVLAAARAAAAGADLQAVVAAARDLVGRTHLYFVVDTLEYLYRGGRIGAASKWLGSALKLKPILEIREGVAQPLARVRTRAKALERVYSLLEKQFQPDDKIHMSVLHVAVPEEAELFRQELERRFQPVESLITECSPVIGAHAGPGTVGVNFYTE